MASIASYVAGQSASTSTLSTSTGSGTTADITAGAKSLSTSYQTFLTLLTTQLKHQDPSAPMDPNQFTTELVQMTGVQQQLLSNQLLQQLVNASPASGVSSAVNLIGKTVTATSASAKLSGGAASWTYTLPSAASTATVSVSNAAGQVVYSGTAPNLASGSSTFTWNGKSSAGVQQSDGGVYTLSIAAAGASGSTITPTISVTGAATSVQSVNGTTQVTIAGAAVPVSAITGVSGS